MSVRLVTERPERYGYPAYLNAVTRIIAAMVEAIASIITPYQRVPLNERDWLYLLAIMFPFVDDARRDIAIEARRFYDAERDKHVSSIRVPVFGRDEIFGPDGRPVRLDDDTELDQELWERADFDIPSYFPEWFRESMGAVRDDYVRGDATDGSVIRLVGQTIKEAENAGRVGTLRAVENDPKVLGWARVEGTENIGSCGFCAMLISRGPVYKSAQNAGLDVSDRTTAVEIFRQAEQSGNDDELMKLMTRWHPNCDCKVVPVFNENDWTGKTQADALYALWEKVTKGYSGRNALNAFRRAIERGEDLPREVVRPAA